MNFIKTQDIETAKKLREEGFQEITETGSKFFTFVNNGTISFSEEEKKNITYSNTLCI